MNMYLDNFDSGFGICKTDAHEQLTNLEFYLSFHRNICIHINVQNFYLLKIDLKIFEISIQVLKFEKLI